MNLVSSGEHENHGGGKLDKSRSPKQFVCIAIRVKGLPRAIGCFWKFQLLHYVMPIHTPQNQNSLAGLREWISAERNPNTTVFHNSSALCFYAWQPRPYILNRCTSSYSTQFVAHFFLVLETRSEHVTNVPNRSGKAIWSNIGNSIFLHWRK